MTIHLESVACAAVDVDELLSIGGNSLMYYTPQYLNFLSNILTNTEVVYLLARKSGALEGVLPIAICTHDKLGTVINSLPFFGSHGGPFVNIAAHDANEVRLELMHACKEWVDERQASSVTLIENPFHPWSDEMAFVAKVSCIDDRIGQITQLPHTSNDVKEFLFAQCHVKTRNSIRKGQKYEQQITQRTDIESLQWLQIVHEQSISSLGGIPKPLHIFQSLIASFGDNARLYVGELDGLPASGLLVVLYGNTVEYFTPVVEPEHKNKQLLSSLIFAVMTELAHEGYTRWNWGGTWRSQEGVYRFKSRWGAKDYPYRYFNTVTDPAFISHSTDELRQAFPFFYLFKY
ncbi:MAG: GNAT family N-acetyltransferase [Leptolyngbyaceae cyanobacterium]